MTGCNLQSCQSFWFIHQEVSLNWLAVALLLAAWNASDDETFKMLQPRPDALRGYAQVSMRAAQRAAVFGR